MKTRPWSPAPSAPAASGLPAQLGANEMLYLLETGKAPLEVRTVSALYMAMLAMRDGTPCRIAREDGTEVFSVTPQGASALPDFLAALYLLEAILSQQYAEGMSAALNDIEARLAQQRAGDGSSEG